MKLCARWIPIGLLILWAFPVHAAVVEGIAAVVNNDVITIRELDEMVDAYSESLPKTLSNLDRERVIKQSREGLLNKMVDNLILTQEAKRLGITIKEDEVTSTIQDLIKKKNMSLDQLKENLQKEGISYDAYRKDIREQLMKMRLAAREIRAKVAVSDEEIGEYYGKHREIYEGKEAVKIKQILFPVPPKAGLEAKEKIRDLAEAAERKLKAGEPFDEVLQANEKMADTHGGADLGFIEKGTMLPAVDEVAFQLKVGEAGPLIVSPVGFHLIQVLDKRGAGLKPLEAVREEIKEEIGKEKMDRKAAEWIQELRKKSYIDIKPGGNF